MPSYPQPVIKGRYVPGRGGNTRAAVQRLASHLKYNQYRKMGERETPESRFIFSQEGDHIHRRDAVRDIMAHTSRGALYHKIVLSPGEHECINDFRTWTRQVMKDLEERKGIRLHWYAVVQAHERERTSEPHVHLVLAGAGEDFQTGKLQPVRMDTTDYAFMRQQGREHSNFEFFQEQQRVLRELDRQDTTLADTLELPASLATLATKTAQRFIWEMSK